MKLTNKLASLLSLPLLAALVLASAPASASTGGSKEDVNVTVTIPDAGAFEVTDAEFRWGVNSEITSGAHFGGCNFLSAGVAADAGSSRVWNKGDNLYRAKDGNSRIEAPNSKNQWALDSWDTKCLNSAGQEVGTAVNEHGTGAQAVINKGQGHVNPAGGSAKISWQGSFTLVMYGGMTYWSITDPVLTVTNGQGQLTATASGYGSDMNDTSKWTKLNGTKITIAQLPQVILGKKGIISTPAYKGVATKGIGDALQTRTGESWGAFPESWIDFNAKTGQGGYWYSTGSLRDSAKVASDVYISYAPEDSVLAKPDTGTTPRGDQTVEPPAQEENSNKKPLDAGGSTSSTTTSTTILQQAAGALTAPMAELTGEAGTSVLAASETAAAAINWMGKSLIPEAIERVKDYKQPLLWSLAGLLALSSVAWIGFRRGWLIWPFSSKK